MSVLSDQPRLTSVKLVVSGGFGAGKTTFVGAVSEVKPLTTEAELTSHSTGVDDTTLVQGKTTTTVALDFGRITIDPTLVVYLFGTPGQERFGFLWDDLTVGALGAVVLADTRRIEDSFVAIDYFEANRVPFVVGVNGFPGSPRVDEHEIRDALGLDPDVPVVDVDARERLDVKVVLLTLLELLLARATALQVG